MRWFWGLVLIPALAGCTQVSETTQTIMAGSPTPTAQVSQSASATPSPTASVKAVSTVVECWNSQTHESTLCIPGSDPNLLRYCPSWPAPESAKPCVGGPAFTPGTPPPTISLKLVAP